MLRGSRYYSLILGRFWLCQPDIVNGCVTNAKTSWFAPSILVIPVRSIHYQMDVD